MTAKHTPGPWVLDSGISSNVVLIDSNATNGAIGEIVDCRNCANARLIAKSPEMLEALKDAYPYIADDALRERVSNLIADATGVQA